MSIALDRSMRSIDQDGRLRVEESRITRACVSEYLGREVPGYLSLGLDPDKIYRLLRDPNELEKAAATFSHLPVLMKHIPISAEQPRQDLIVGTTGEVIWEAPFLIARPFTVWTGDAIRLIESEQQRELSAAYAYTPVVESGSFQGEPYDIRMTKILGNHVALVAEGRVPGALVADQRPEELMRRATVISKLRPFLVANVDLLALDAALAEVASAAPTLEDEIEAEAAANDFYQNASDSDDPKDSWEKMTAAEKLKARDAWHRARDAKRAKDGGDVDHRKDFDGAQDAAQIVRKQLLAAFEARDAVRPVVGIIALDGGMDTAEAIYGYALKHLGIKTDGIPPSAYGALFDVASTRKTGAHQTMALDAAHDRPTVENIWPATAGRRIRTSIATGDLQN